MQKKNKIIGFIAFALIVLIWSILFNIFKENAQILFPNNLFETYAVTDKDANGFSTSELKILDSSITAFVNVRSGKAYPYAGIGFNLMSQNNRPSGVFDFSKYDSLAVSITTNRMKTVTLRIMTIDPSYSNPENPLTYRPLEKEIPIVSTSKEIKVSLSDFKNKEWWLVAQGLDKDDGLTYFFNSAFFEIFNGENTLRGIPDEIELKHVRMWGANHNFKKGMFFGLICICILFTIFFIKIIKKPKDLCRLNQQLKETERLLIKTDKSIAEIAISVKAKSISSLEREFYKLYKLKPLEYRRKNV